jgi:predicted transcriptional regulator
MTKTTEPATTATPTTDKVADKAVKTAKAKDSATLPDTTEKPAKKSREQASYLAIALHPDLRGRLDTMAKSEGVSSAAIVRRAVMAQFAGQDQADAATTGKVNEVQAGLDVAIAKLKQLDKAIDSALADCVRVADRLARAATADKT